MGFFDSLFGGGSPNIEKLQRNGDVEGLIKALSHSQTYIREQAADALGGIKDSRSIVPLTKTLSDPSSDVQLKAAHSLKHFDGAQISEVLPKVDAILSAHAAQQKKKEEETQAKKVAEQKQMADRPIEKDSQWNPGTKLKFMTYNEAVSALKSGDLARMEKAIGDILNVPKVYNDIAKDMPPENQITNLLLPLLKHEEYRVRCCIPGIFEVIGDDSIIPHLEDVAKNDKDSQVVKNARIAIDKIKRLGVNTDVVKFLRRYTKPIDRTSTGTYEEYSAPSKNVARAYLEKMPPVTKPYFYIEIITPEGNIGKDNTGTY